MELIHAIFQRLSGTASAQSIRYIVIILGIFGFLLLVYNLSVWLDKKSRREPPDNSVEEQGWFHAPEIEESERVWPPAPRKH